MSVCEDLCHGAYFGRAYILSINFIIQKFNLHAVTYVVRYQFNIFYAMLTGRKLWELTKCPWVNQPKYGNAHYRYLQLRASEPLHKQSATKRYICVCIS